MDAASWARAKEVLAEALNRSASEREAFVRARGLGPELTAEVLDILSARADNPAQLSEPYFRLVDQPADLLPAGAHVGPYVIIDALGEGGMGRVYLASDPQLRRRVALKCLLAPIMGERPDTSIINEAIAAARVTHPNVAAVHHVVEQDQRVYIVMEYVDGENLAVRLKRERLSIEQVVSIGRQLASALAAAHAKGIVHRDLKPGNVQFASNGTAKVLDFGIANLAMTLTVDSSHTTTRTVGVVSEPQPGTPPYMSPEQLRGQSVGERSDLFSLGVLLFEMATGRRPFDSNDPQELMRLQAAGAPRANAVNRKVPRLLAAVIAGALKTDLNQRTKSAVEIEVGLVEVAEQIRKKTALELVRLWLARVAIGVPVTITVIGLVGFITTWGFNSTFGRTGQLARFGVEPWRAYLSWGLLRVFPSIVMMTLVAVIFLLARALFRALELIGPIGRLTARARAWARRAALALGLDRSNTLGQNLTGLGILAILGLFWQHASLINAWASFFNSAPIQTLLPMGPTLFARQRYQVELDVLTLVLGVGFFKVLQLRKAEKTSEGLAGVATLALVIAIVVLMASFPYRTLNWRDFERVMMGGEQCYITGQSGNEFLVLCPQSSPPRNRVVRSDDPSLVRTGKVENVFEGLTPSRSSS